MAISNADVAKVRQHVRNGAIFSTPVLSLSLTSYDIHLGSAFSKVSFQGTGDLAGTLTFSLDGINFKSSTAIAGTNDLASFSTHNVVIVRVTRTSGTGRVAIACQ